MTSKTPLKSNSPSKKSNFAQAGAQPLLYSVGQDMVLQPKQQFNDCQRIQVAKEVQGPDTVLKISLERFDETLGWYSAGALAIPIHQLPLLQQALDEMNCTDCTECRDTCQGKIISFPLMIKDSAAELAEV